MSGTNGNARGIPHATLLVGLLGICATVVLGIVSWVLMTLVDVRDRVRAIEVTRPLYEHRFTAMEVELRRLTLASQGPHLERPPGWSDDQGGAN